MFKQTAKRIFLSGWNNFKRNSYISFGTTGVMTLVLLLFLGLITLNFIFSTIVASLENKVDVSVYFKTEAADQEIAQVRKDLEGLDTVAHVDYISRDKALADFRVKHAGDALIQDSLAELGDNPLQASLNVKAKDSSQYAAIVQSIEGNKFRSLIDKINFYENEQVITKIENISRGLQNGGFLATLALACIAVLVTFNTVRLTIYNQKSEIEIMRLVGGTNWHIRLPYLVEGAMYGGFAAVIALALFYPVAYSVSPKLALILPDASLMKYFADHVVRFSFLTLFIGVLLGMVSSFIAMRKFLKI